jgi:NTP pyrophosphatase (non-canonical NTP hydrolase)
MQTAARVNTNEPAYAVEVEVACALLTDLCHGAARKGGWWSNLKTGEPLQRNQGELIALMHSELSEALEGVRKDKMDEHLPHRKSVEVELADAVIRIFDFAGGFGLSIGPAIVEKMAFNARRADHKVENRIKDDGKKF